MTEQRAGSDRVPAITPATTPPTPTDLRAVVFDLDGVLVDSEPYWQAAFAAVANAYIEENKLERAELSASDLHAFEGGRANDTMRAIVSDLAGRDLSEEEVEDLTDRVITLVCARFVAAPTPISASVDTANWLADRGIPLGVASSSASRFILVALRAIGLSERISVVESAYPLAAGKPDPEVYLRACRALGVHPAQALAVEDSSRGLQAACRAGMPAVWLTPSASLGSTVVPAEVCRDNEVVVAQSLEPAIVARLLGLPLAD